MNEKRIFKMSQKKMDAYKNAKKNRKQIEKQQKRKRVISWICGILGALVVIAGCVFLVYYTNVTLPEKEAAEAAAADTETTSGNSTNDVANDVLNMLNDSLGEDYAGDDDSGVYTVPTADGTDEATSEASDAGTSEEETSETDDVETDTTADTQ